jgi:tRNA(Arg) A34 adenosine deaminase TadA
MMAVAVEISARNVETGDGGPFGAAVFERSKSTQTARLFAVGANRVVPLNNCTLHGETVALQFAQQKLQSFSLRTDGDKEYVLCTSCEPCAMCLGATFWSGVSEMICAATKEDCEAIGFDEGPVFPESYVKLEEVGTKVTRRILRDEGAKILKDYGSKTGSVLYN